MNNIYSNFEETEKTELPLFICITDYFVSHVKIKNSSRRNLNLG